MIGYGRAAPDPKWPGEARLALQFVLNYEEGGENCILHGDAASESFLSEIVNAVPYHGVRHMSMESLFEYGSRVGLWRLLRLFRERDLPLTVFAVGMALLRNPEAAAAFVEDGHEVASHGWRWIDYQFIDEETEREHIGLAVAAIEKATGRRPEGWYTGRDSPNTRRLVVAHGGFLYDADSYSDELPYWQLVEDTPHLIVPYTLDANDMRFSTAAGFDTGESFFSYLKDTFDLMYAEGAETPRMMSVGLHCRLAGRPGRAAALQRFLDYVAGHDRVWICRRVDIARHWRAHHPWRGDGKNPAALSARSGADFVATFAPLFENAAWIAEAAAKAAPYESPEAACDAMIAIMRRAPRERQMALIRGHPDLAGKAAIAGEMTEHSIGEQASAGLDHCTPAEFARFGELNNAYRQKFDMPFVMAVQGRTRAEILAAFERRLANSAEREFETALDEIAEIARLRLKRLAEG